MKTRLLKKLTFVFALFAATNLSAQLVYTFDTDVQGWTAGGISPNVFASTINFATGTSPNTGLAVIAPREDDSTPNPGNTLTQNTIMYGPNNGAGGMNADGYNTLKIVLKNQTAGTTLRVRCNSNTIGSTWMQQDFTISANDTGFKTYIFTLNTTQWNGTASDIAIVIRDTSGAWDVNKQVSFNSVRFSYVLPTTSFAGWIQNPSLDDAPASILPFNAGGSIATAITAEETHTGDYSIKHTWLTAPTGTGYNYNSYVKNIGTSTTNEVTATFWVKVLRPNGSGGFATSPKLTFTGQIRTGTVSTTLVIKQVDAATTKTDGTWEKITIVGTPAAAYTFGNFRYGIKFVSGGTGGDPANNIQAGDIVYVDDVSADWTAALSAIATTWDGSAWTVIAPTSTSEATIAGNYSTTANGSITAKKLIVNSGTLTINSGTNVRITNEIINNAGANGIVIQNNANLIQVNNVANTGTAVVHRNSSLLKLNDYTLWSSPVAGQQLKAFSPSTIDSRFYTYNTTSPNSNQYATVDNTTNFATGKGYLIRMPNTASASTPTAYAGVFTGVLNNGNITFSMASGGPADRYNLVGNPYPSPISIPAFVATNGPSGTNEITGTLYFWRRSNNVTGVYTNSAYCTVVGGVFTSNGDAQAVNPNGVIQIGQGFFVEATGGSNSLNFNNAQRIANNAGQFFKTKQVAEDNVIWLNAKNSDGAFSQMALGYYSDGTTGVDQYDGKAIGDGTFAFNSTIDNVAYTIQGRPVFNASDVVTLNFKTATAGTYTISKDHANGLFAAGQEVYLVDATTGTQTNLQTDDYTFDAAAGTDNSRFSLLYQKTLGLNAAAFNENSIKIYRSNGVLNVTSAATAISNIKVYDIQGRLLAEQKNVNATTATIKNLKASHQVIIVKVTSADHTILTKKVVN